MDQGKESISIRKVLSAVAMFIAGFILVAAAIHVSLGNGLKLHADIRSEKLQLMDQWQGKAYTAAFGSSHVHNGFDPRTFDVTIAGTPLQTRSLNLAISGGSQTEQRVEALSFLKNLNAPPRIGAPIESRACMVILELNAGANFTNEHLIHPRAINIYDLDTVRFVSKLVTPQMGLQQRIGRIGYSLLAMVLHYTNVGMLSSDIFAPPIDHEMFHAETIDDRRGLYTVYLGPDVKPRVEAHLRKIVAEAPPSSQATPEELLPGNRELLNELAAASPVRNLSYVYLVMPMLTDLKNYPMPPDEIAWSGGTAPIINMARPDLYPELFQVKYWVDDAHLNEQGARLFTRLMAERLKQWYVAHGWPQRCGG